MKKTRILTLLLAAAVAVTAAGCAAKTPEPSPAPVEPAPAPVQQPTESVTYEATGVRGDEIIARLGDAEVPAELLTYEIGYVCSYLDYTLQSYGMGGLDISGTLPNGENAAEYALDEALSLVKQQLVLEQLAAENGITISEEDEAALAAQRDADLAELGEETYYAQLRSMGLSPEGYDRVLRAGYLYQALSAAASKSGTSFYISGDRLAARADGEGYITADHILLMTVDPDTRAPLDEATVAQKRAQAEDLLRQLRESEDPLTLFSQLADAYSEDPGRQTNPEGYTFKHGTMVEAFDSAARALEENTFSDVVESGYGFHIILRRPLDVDAATDAVRETYFDELFLSLVEEAELTLTPVMDRYDPAAVYNALHAAQEEAFGS